MTGSESNARTLKGSEMRTRTKTIREQRLVQGCTVEKEKDENKKESKEGEDKIKCTGEDKNEDKKDENKNEDKKHEDKNKAKMGEEKIKWTGEDKKDLPPL